MNIVNWQCLSKQEQEKALARPPLSQQQEVIEQATTIIDQVKQGGDDALFELTKAFDGVSLNALSARCNPPALEAESQKALDMAIQTIGDYHLAMKPQNIDVETAPGVNLSKVYKPIQRIGFYVPGGDTPLISSLLMMAIPGKIAGNPLKIVCTPPNREGKIDDMLLMAAKLCGIEQVYTIGGAQAIAAMAYGTKSIPKVDKIFGPGNRFVTAAKTLVAQDPNGASIDMPAGPSELMILVDDKANPEFIAADLLSQAEHGIDSQVMLVTDSNKLVERVFSAIEQQKKTLGRIDIINQSLACSRAIVCSNLKEMIDIANDYAAEHLILNLQDPESIIDDIQAAGSIFVGPWAAESLGDYISGSNHVLPTYGYARSISGLSTIDFMNAVSIQRISEQGIKVLGAQAKILALKEGLAAHANAITVRENALCQ